MNYQLTPDLEAQSKFGTPYEGSRTRYWQALHDGKPGERKPSGNKGWLRANAEMEALDRLREAFPGVGIIEWIPRSQYEKWAVTIHGETYTSLTKIGDAHLISLEVLTEQECLDLTEDKLLALFPGKTYVQFGSSDTLAYAYQNLIDRLDINGFDTRSLKLKPTGQVQRLSEAEANELKEIVVAIGFNIK